MNAFPETDTVVDVLLQCIEAEGVEYMFGVPGGAITPLHEALRQRDRIKYILAKHEEGAAFMANGYARVSRGLGVCCATTGPGGTNALTGVAASYADSVPVLMLSGQVSTRAFGRGSLQDSTAFGVDLVQIFQPVTKLSAMASSVSRAPDLVRRALRTALCGRPGPVHLSLPVDMLKQEVQWHQLAPSQYRAKAAFVDREAAAEAARALVGAERPCFLVGHGANIAGATEALTRLAELLQAPVATTPKAKGIFPEDHELSLGVFGFAGHRWAESYLLSDRVDVLVAIGTSLGELQTNAWDRSLLPSRAFIQIDIDPYEIGKNYPVDIGLVGDANATLREIADLAEDLLGGRPRERGPIWEIREEAPRYVSVERLSRDASPMKPQLLVQEMRAVLPDDALLFVDSGNSVSWAVHYYEVRRPNTFFVNMGLASMGHATAAAIGGKLAAPDKPVVALVGDAAFAMSGMEVHTAVDHGIPVVWVVLNDGGHGMVYHGEKMLLGHDLGACHFRVPLDIAGLAMAMGAGSYRVETLDAFRSALEEALLRDEPCVIDARIDPEEIPHSLARRARTVAASVDNMALSIRMPKFRLR